MSGPIDLDDETVRRWLNLLRHPIRLDTPEMRALLRAHGRLPRQGSPVDVGRAAARLLTDTIDGLAPPPDAPTAERLPHAVLRTCFVEGTKLHQAATKLGLSERQLTRERGRAISLLTAQLSLGPAHAFVPEEIPASGDVVPRVDVTAAIEVSLTRSRVAHVHGPPGIGKTTVVAALAVRETRRGAVWWYRFRRSVNDTLPAVIFEMGRWLASQGLGELAEYVAPNIADLDPAVAARVAIQTVGRTNALLVLDDFHVVEDDPAIAGFFDEAVLRTPTLRLVTLSRHRPAAARARDAIEVPPFRLDQTEHLMSKLRVRRPHETVAKIHAWTAGNPHLVRLSAAWLTDATAQETARGVTSLVDRAEVQEFLLDNVAELLEGDDRAVLEAASVFRGRFSDDALAYVAQLTRGAVQDATQRLARAYLVTRNRQGVSTFFHAGVRDYVYERLERELRAGLHLRAAAWFHRAGDEDETRFHRRSAGLEA